MQAAGASIGSEFDVQPQEILRVFFVREEYIICVEAH